MRWLLLAGLKRFDKISRLVPRLTTTTALTNHASIRFQQVRENRRG